jgi:hypothetical protein
MEMIVCEYRENLREEHHLEDRGVDGRILLKCTLMKLRCWGMDWNDFAQDRDTCRL